VDAVPGITLVVVKFDDSVQLPLQASFDHGRKVPRGAAFSESSADCRAEKKTTTTPNFSFCYSMNLKPPGKRSCS